MKKLQFNVLFIISICFAALLTGAQPVNAFGHIPSGSSIAGISLEGMSIDEAQRELESKVIDWQSLPPLEAKSEYETIEIPRSLFTFHIEPSINELEERTKRHWSTFFIKPKNIRIPIQVELNQNEAEAADWHPSIDKEATLNKALLIAGNLSEDIIALEYDESASFDQNEIAEVVLSIPDISLATVTHLAQELDGEILAKDDIFSYLEEIVLPQGLVNPELEMSFIASGLYQLALHTELEVVERHQAETIPAYTEPGLEAVISREDKKNLILYNPSNELFTIHANVTENDLIMSISSRDEETSYTYVRENIKEIEPRTIYRYSSSMLPGQEIVRTEGSAGLQLEIHRKQSAGSGEEEKELITRDFYPPKHEVILVSTAEETESNEEETDDGSRNNSIAGRVSEDLDEKLNKIAGCEGDPDCESENNVTEFDKMLAACFSEDGEQASDAAANTEENSFCDLIYMMLFFSLLEEMSADETAEETDSENINLSEELSDLEDLTTDEEIEDIEEVVK